MESIRKNIKPMSHFDRDDLKKAQEGDLAARDRIWLANMGLVYKIASCYNYAPIDLADVVGEGQLGILDAIEKYDPEKGMSFNWFAGFYIRERIRTLLELKFPFRYPRRKWKDRMFIEKNSIDDKNNYLTNYLAVTLDKSYQEILDVLSILKEKEQQLLFDHFYKGIEKKELAKRENITHAGMTLRFRQIIKKLKTELEVRDE